jgi:hydroxymethylpyrimidine pyrophosphatase-like HAD family hydrolase
MANAPQDVRDQADIVAPSNDEDGVAMVLERLFMFRSDSLVVFL